METDDVIYTHDCAQAFIKGCLPGLKVKFYDCVDSGNGRRKRYEVIFEKLGMRTLQQAAIYSLPFRTLRFRQYLRELVSTVEKVYQRNYKHDG